MSFSVQPREPSGKRSRTTSFGARRSYPGGPSMTIRGDGDPGANMARKAASENGPVAPELRRRCARLHHGLAPGGSTAYKIRSALRAHLRGVKMGSTARWLWMLF